MAAAPLESIYSDVDYYFKTYETFIQKSVADSGELWRTQWDGIIKSLSEKVNDNAGNDVRMLAVASGQGYLEQMIIEILVKYFPSSNLHIDVIEPAEEQLEKFKTKAADMVTKYPNLTFSWFADTFEGYVQRRGNTNHKFHLLVCVNGLYYMDDWKCALDQFYDSLLPGGVMANTIDSGSSACGTLFQKFREWEGNSANLLTAADITSYIETQGMTYQSHVRSGAIDVTDTFDESSADGNMVLDFLVQRKDFRQKAPPKLLQQVFDFVRKNSSEDKGRVLMSDDEIDIVIVKKV